MPVSTELLDEDLLFQLLSMISPVSLALQDTFKRFLRDEEHPKKHVLLREGQVARRIYLIRQGFARAYYHDPDGGEHTSWFMAPGDLMISVHSFFTQQPSHETIELTEHSALQSMTWQQLQTVYAEHPEFNLFGRKMTEKYYILAEERAIMLRCKRPIERYELLLRTHPRILQQATLTQIASYLGIKLETLSRLRASI